MNTSRLTDAELARALRAHLPAAPASDIREAIRAHTESTAQVRSLPGVLGTFVDADDMARRRALLFAAAALLALGAAVAGVVGGILDHPSPDPIPDLSLQRPGDMPGFVRSAYGAMPRLPPMTIMSTVDGASRTRIYVDASGAIRVERFTTLDAASPASFEIYAGTSHGEMVLIDAKPAWYQQADAISEDPRVFVYAELSRGRSDPGPGSRCEVAVSPEEVYSYTPGSGWRYVGAELVAGRATHHVSCAGAGDLWIDVETRLVLRSRDEAAEHTVEVTSVELGQPPSALFEIRPPAGVRIVSAEEYERSQCIRYGWCLESPIPLTTPRPAPDQKPILTAGELVGLAGKAPARLGPYAITDEGLNTGMTGQGTVTVVFFDGANRYRIEMTSQVGTQWEATTIMVIGDGYRYASNLEVDGTTTWRDLSRRASGSAYLPGIQAACERGWEHRGVDLIGERVADHVGCLDGAQDYWIDRETHLVLRTQVAEEGMGGTLVREIVEIRLGVPEGIDWDPKGK